MCLFVGGPPEVESDGVLGVVLEVEEEDEEVEEEELEQQELKLEDEDEEGEQEAKEEVEEKELVLEELDEQEEVEGEEAEAAAAGTPALAGRATIAPTLVGIVVVDLEEVLVVVRRAVEPMVAETPESQSRSSSSTMRRHPAIRESTSDCSALKCWKVV